MDNEFQQPRVDNAPLPVSQNKPGNPSILTEKDFDATDTDPVAHMGNADADPINELDAAVDASRVGVVSTAAQPGAALPGKYRLRYPYKGKIVAETHATLPHAVSRVAALARMGINDVEKSVAEGPATGTDLETV